MKNEPKAGGRAVPRKPDSGASQSPADHWLRIQSEERQEGQLERQAGEGSRRALCQAKGLGFYSESNLCVCGGERGGGCLQVGGQLKDSDLEKRHNQISVLELSFWPQCRREDGKGGGRQVGKPLQ